MNNTKQQINNIVSTLTFRTIALGGDKTTEEIEALAVEAIDKLIIEARIDELNMLTRWKVSNNGDDNWDIVLARHERSYDDRIQELKQELNK